ncbi:MAG: agmatinase [Candidatus Melainabacteria bacterium]
MLRGPLKPLTWMGATDSFHRADWVIVGIPYDGTTSFRPGTRFGPQAIRAMSWGIETYSPSADATLDNVAYYDAGDLELPFGNRSKTLDIIRHNAKDCLLQGKKWLGLGGEHLVTYPVIQSYIEQYPDLGILHFDAHADLRDEFMDEKYSHATVMRRVVDLLDEKSAGNGHTRLVQVGIRSGTEDEFDWMHKNGTLIRKKDDLATALQKLKGRPVFLTIDLDVLDPSVMSGTGTPEPGGMRFKSLIHWLHAFSELNFVGADVVELAPDYDPTGVSTMVAAKVVREIMLLNPAS